MSDLIVHIPDLSAEFEFQFSRSSGPGGQNVNKVNSKVELRFHLQDSTILNNEQKTILQEKLGSKISSEGYLIVVSQRDRSQPVNKEDVIRKFYQLLERALRKEKPRKPTIPTRTSVEKRLTGKRMKAEIKQGRQRLEE